MPLFQKFEISIWLLFKSLMRFILCKTHMFIYLKLLLVVFSSSLVLIFSETLRRLFVEQGESGLGAGPSDSETKRNRLPGFQVR